MMFDLLPSLIELFGALSAILIAFTIFLHDKLNKNLEELKDSLLSRINDSVNNPDIVSSKVFGNNPDLADKLLKSGGEVVNHNIVSYISQLKETITVLRDQGKKDGEKAKRALIIEDEELRDIEKKYSDYKQAKSTLENLPKITYLSVGIPLAIAIFFISVAHFEFSFITQKHFENFIYTIAVGGLIGIFFLTVYFTRRL